MLVRIRRKGNPCARLVGMYWFSHYGKQDGSSSKNSQQIHHVFGVCSVTQSCPTLCNPMDYSPPGSSVRKIFQARIMEWLPFPAPGDLLDSGIKLESLKSPALAGRFFTYAPPGKPTPLRSTWIIVFDANFLNGFAVAKHPLPNGRG